MNRRAVSEAEGRAFADEHGCSSWKPPPNNGSTSDGRAAGGGVRALANGTIEAGDRRASKSGPERARADAGGGGC